MSEHIHRWRKVYEEFLLGGAFPIGWECSICQKFVATGELTPAGLDGEVGRGARLIAPHGGQSLTSSGKPYHEQIIDDDGNLSIIERSHS